MQWQWENKIQGKWYALFLWVYALAAGFLVAAALPPKLFSGLEWVALVPFFGLLLLPMRRGRDLFFFGWLAGVAAFGLYLSWFFDAVPLIWIGIPGYGAGLALAAMGLSLPVLYLALFWGAFLAFVEKLSKNIAQKVLWIVFLWPVFEYLRVLSYSFHPFAQGEGHIFGDHFGALLMGYALAEYDSWRQLAGILGPYGISIAVVIPNALIFGLIAVFLQKPRDFTYHHAGAALLLLVVFVSLFFATKLVGRDGRENTRTLLIAILQLNDRPEYWVADPKKQREFLRDRVAALFKEAQKNSPDIIVTPEGAPTIFSERSGSSLLSLEKISQKLNGGYQLVVDADGFVAGVSRRDRNSTILLDNYGVRGVYEKRFLMPWGEYLPYSFIWGARLAGASVWLDNQLSLRSYTPGSQTGVFDTPLGKVGLLTCSEILSPKLIRDGIRAGTDIFILSSSDRILRGSERLAAQNLAMGQIHAATARAPLIYASNAGKSFALDAHGRILWKSEKAGEEAAIVRVILE